MSRAQLATIIVDAVASAIVLVIGLWVAPEYRDFALALVALFQGVALALVAYFLGREVRALRAEIVEALRTLGR